MSTCSFNFDNTHLGLNDYSNAFVNVLAGRNSTVVQESGPIYTYVKDLNLENSNNTYAVHTNKMMTHTKSISAHSCFLDPLKKDIMEKNKEVPTKFPTNIGKGKKCCAKVKAEKQNLLNSAAIRDNLCSVTWSHVKFPSTQSKKFLKDNSTDKIVNDSSSIKYIRDIANADDDEIISGNSSLKYVNDFSISDDNEIVSDTSSIKNLRENSSPINSSYIKFSPRQSSTNKILKDCYTKETVNDTYSLKYKKSTSTADNYEISSDNSLIKHATEFLNADDNKIVSDTSSVESISGGLSAVYNEIVSDTFSIESIKGGLSADDNEIVSDTFSVESIREGLYPDDNEVISSNCSLKSIGESLKGEIRYIDDTPKRIYLKQLDDRRESKRIPIRMANLPRKMFTRDKNEVRITREDIQIVEPNSDRETFDINKFLRKTRRKLNFSLDDIDENASETYTCTTEDSNVMNELSETVDLEKSTVTKNNSSSKQKSKALENFFNELSEIVDLEKSTVTKYNKNSKQKSKALDNFLNGISEANDLEKSTDSENNMNSKHKSKALENFLYGISETSNLEKSTVTKNSNKSKALEDFLNELSETNDLEKSTITENNQNSKQKPKALENVLNGLSESSDLEKITITQNNKNSKQKSKDLENFLNEITEASDLEKLTVTKNNKNSKQESRDLEKPDKKFFFEGYIDKLKDIARKPPMTQRAKAFEEKAYPKVYFDFDDYCAKLFNLKEKFNEKKNENNKQD